MKQILQNLKTGDLEITEVPLPSVRPGYLLIQTRCSLISSGTERMLVSFAQSGLIGKARQQPDKVRQVMDKIKSDGLLPTIHSVFARLDEPLPLGYCNCGVVLEVGAGVEGFKIGDRVANNGPHAEIVCVPKNLCAKVPDNVSDEEACFTVLAAIGLEGIRLIHPTFGETVVVFGLGLIGLMCVQLLKGCGCKVICIDLDKKRLEQAEKYGAKVVDVSAGAEVVAAAKAFTSGTGVDAVLITASAKEDSIVHQSAQMCRKRGRIVLVGVVDLNINRADFYEKELTFQVSCSYGPGRYDSSYEEGGRDYPYGFVRWTEQRNFEAVLNSMAAGTLKLSELISERITQAQAQRAYQMLDDPGKMAMILTYPRTDAVLEKTITMPAPAIEVVPTPKVIAGLIGAGNFAKITLLPILKKLDVKLKTVADINGVSGAYSARKFGFAKATNDYKEILNDPEINTVFVTTRHDLHAKMVIEALQAGKHVAVEKPLCLNVEELAKIKEAYRKTPDRILTVGFNRRFSPHAQKMYQLLQTRNEPLCMTMVVNAGYIPADSWVQNKIIGGGRIIGEGCHWIDLMSFLAGARIVNVSAVAIGRTAGTETQDDKVSIAMRFEDGSIGTLHYFANGHKSFPKETLYVFCGGRVLLMDNFRRLKGYGWRNFSKMNLWSQDKGHKKEFMEFIAAVGKGTGAILSFEEIENVTLASFAAVESLTTGSAINI